MTPPPTAETVLEFWVGPLDALGLASKDQVKKWFAKDPAFDDDVRERFLATFESVLAGELEDWRQTPRGAAAYVIVLDQFSRNMFRDQARMYAGDARAVEAALAAIEQGDDRELAPSVRSFLYMPLMHSEEIEHQDKCVALFEAFNAEAEGEVLNRLGGNLGFAERHRAIVADWGRFPHRNKILGRESTPEEVKFLEGPGSSF